MEAATRGYFKSTGFHVTTGIGADKMHYCRKRHEKMPIARDLGLTHFIDDRLEVLGYMVGVVPNLYLFCGRESEIEEHKHHLPKVIRFAGWHILTAWFSKTVWSDL